MSNRMRDWGTQCVTWLKTKDASFWISVTSAIIATWTFYFVYLSGPRLRVQLPKHIGLLTPEEGNGRYQLLIPAIFYNAGPERSAVAITDVNASLTSDGKPLPLKFDWYETERWVSVGEYKKEYPEEYANDIAHNKHVGDYVVYESQDYPFVLFGGSSATKILKLWTENPGTKIVDLSSFDLSLTAMAGGQKFTTTARYLIDSKPERGIFVRFTKRR